MNKYLVIAVIFALLLSVIVYLKSRGDSLALELEVSQAEVSGLKESIEKTRLAMVARDEVDAKFTQELTDAKQENDRLRADVAAGSRRVLVRASCPSVSTTSSSSSVDDGAEPALTADAREDYFRLRDQIVRTEKQLAGLQEYVGRVCLSRGVDGSR